MAGHVLAVASGKGGVGKTTTVVNLGVVLRRANYTVALVDADLGMANLGTLLGIEGEDTLHDVLAGKSSVAQAIVEGAEGFAVLSGSSDLRAFPDAKPRGLGGVLADLAAVYDFVIVDTGAGMSHEDILPLGLADRVVLVSTPEPAAIGDTQKTAELADLSRGSIAGLVVTKADDATDPEAVAREVGVKLLGVVPFDAAVRRSASTATPLEAVDPEAPAAKAYRDIAATLVETLPEPSAGPPLAAEAPMDVETQLDEAAEVANETEAALDEAKAERVGPDRRDPPDTAEADHGTGEPDAGQPVDEGDGPSAASMSPGSEGPAGPSEAPDETDRGSPATGDEPPAATETATVGASSGPEPPVRERRRPTEPGEADAPTPAGVGPDENLDELLEEFEANDDRSDSGLLSRLGRLFR